MWIKIRAVTPEYKMTPMLGLFLMPIRGETNGTIFDSVINITFFTRNGKFLNQNNMEYTHTIFQHILFRMDHFCNFDISK